MTESVLQISGADNFFCQIFTPW